MTKEEFLQFIEQTKAELATNLQKLGFQEKIARNVAGHFFAVKALFRSSYSHNREEQLRVFRVLSDPFYNEQSTSDKFHGIFGFIKDAIKPEKTISFEEIEPRIQDYISVEIQDMADWEESCFAYMLCAFVFKFEPFGSSHVPQNLIDGHVYWQVIVPSRDSNTGPDNTLEL